MISTEEVEKLREKTGCSIADARNFLQYKELSDELDAVMASSSLEEKIDFILRNERNKIDEFFKSRLVRLVFREECEKILSNR
jgi:hypothetical protein